MSTFLFAILSNLILLKNGKKKVGLFWKKKLCSFLCNPDFF